MLLMEELTALKIHQRDGPAVLFVQVNQMSWYSKIRCLCGSMECKLSVTYENLLLVDCSWNPWSSWTSCGSSCNARDGTGDQQRTRSPRRFALNGGTHCTSATERQRRACSAACPGKLNVNGLKKSFEGVDIIMSLLHS